MRTHTSHRPKSGTIGENSRAILVSQVRKPEFWVLSALFINCNLDFTLLLPTSIFSPVKWSTENRKPSCLPYRVITRPQQDWNCKNGLCSREPYTNVCYYYYCYYYYYYTMFFGEDIYVKLTQHVIGVLKLNKWSQLSDSFKINDVITT